MFDDVFFYDDNIYYRNPQQAASPQKRNRK
jgi:hypothetical protein